MTARASRSFIRSFNSHSKLKSLKNVRRFSNMSKETFLLASMAKFFDEPMNKQKLHAILGGKSHGPSLRKIEWFVTNYSKHNHVTYTAPNGKMFTVHVAYKSSLDGYSKKLFDPFCRTDRIEFQGLSTTVGQLNFLKWVITNGILDSLKGMEGKQTHPEIAKEYIRSNICTN